MRRKVGIVFVECATCPVRGVHCGDCVVTALHDLSVAAHGDQGRPSGHASGAAVGVSLDAAERLAVHAFVAAGLVSAARAHALSAQVTSSPGRRAVASW